MAIFSYIARTSTNSTQTGVVTAKDRGAALESLRIKGLVPVLVKQAGRKRQLNFGKLKLGKKKVKSRDMVIFTRELSTMINAGVPILRSLRTLLDQTDSAVFKRTLESVTAKVEGGSPISDALGEYPKVFSLVYVNMVRAGEAGGILDQILERLAVQVEKDAEIKSKLKGAMIYPGIITFITFGAFIFLMTGIVPKLKEIFDQYNATLPLQTRIMLRISEVMQKFWPILLILSIVLIVVFVRAIRRPKGKYWFDKLTLKMPLFGKIILKVNIARFARTFSSLTTAGVAVLDGLNVTSKSLNNVIIQASLIEASKKVKNGLPISSALEEGGIFPPILTQMAAIGEETGQIDVVLAKVANFYESEVDRVIANLTSIIEPLLIVVLGGMVGLIVGSVFGPISSLTEVVQ